MSPPLSAHRVLSTLESDGRRHWISPRTARGRFLRWRRIVGYALVAMFVGIPFLRLGGRPALQIDLEARQLNLFGSVFRPSDNIELMLLGLTIVMTVFLVTALFGRVWCGWGCPQTVYMEHVFRPIERWLEGTPGQKRLHGSSRYARRAAKWAIFAALAFALANVFLSYFVGTDRLFQWVLGSPTEHLGGFLLVTGVAALMLFDFGYFREQMCIVACPYGRLQSVLLDKQSLIVGYDKGRGEPRGKPRKKLPVLEQTAAQGDCVECGACVAVCPTGIDIRDGLQMECVGCAQCIDACDPVMDKVGKKRGLIRYTSQEELAGHKRKVLRPRTIVYPALIAIAAGALTWTTNTRPPAFITVERNQGASFFDLGGGKVAAQLHLSVENDSDEARRYTVTLLDAPDAALRLPQPTWQVAPRKAIEIPVFVDVERSTFVHGERRVHLRIDDDAGFERVVTATLIGPDGGAK